MGGTDGFSGEHPSGGGRGYGRGFSLFMGQPSHISRQESHRSWIIQSCNHESSSGKPKRNTVTIKKDRDRKSESTQDISCETRAGGVDPACLGGEVSSPRQMTN